MAVSNQRASAVAPFTKNSCVVGSGSYDDLINKRGTTTGKIDNNNPFDANHAAFRIACSPANLINTARPQDLSTMRILSKRLRNAKNLSRIGKSI